MNFEALQIGDLIAEKPLVQGGMGVGVSLGGLAGAVAAQGGVGIISGVQMGFREPDFRRNSHEANLRILEREVKKAKEIASGHGIVGMNIMVAFNTYADTVKAAVKAGIDLIVCGAGLPLSLPKLVGDAKVKIAPIVSSGRAARVILKSWAQKYDRLPDLLVVEGAEAGGHLGFKREELLSKTYQPLVDIVADVRAELLPYEKEQKVSIPIVAGGGLNFASEVESLLNSGANGVQIATPFIATEECDADPRYKEVYVKANAADLRIVQSPAGMPGRAILSPLLERLKLDREPIKFCTRCLAPCDPATTSYCITQALMAAVDGHWEEGLFFSGAGVEHIKRISTVKEVMSRFLD